MSSVVTDPTTGSHHMVQKHEMLLTLFDDSVYLGLMVLLYDQTGVSRFFLQLPSIMAENSRAMQSLRYGIMFGSMFELRRWMIMMGINTDASSIFQYLLDKIKNMGSSTR